MIATAEEAVLIAGRLHPSSIFIHLVRGILRNIWVYGFLIWQMFRGDRSATVGLGWELWALIMVAGASLSSSVVEYFTYRYQLTSRFLHIRRGYFRRLERRIPIDRIQDLTAEQGVVQRFFGVVRVAVQTSSTAGAEAKLDSITPSDLDALRRELQRVQASAGSADEEPSEPANPELWRITTWQLAQRGLTDGRAALVLLGVGYVFQQMFDLSDLKLVKPLVAWGGQFFATLKEQSFWSMATAMVLMGVGLWFVGLAAAVIANVVRFHGFVLTDTNGTLRRRYGLLNQQEHTLPRGRIQGMRLRQSLLRRWFGLAELTIHSMGTATSTAAARKAGTNVFIPIGRRAQLEQLVCHLLPRLEHQNAQWQPISPRIIRRYFARGVILAVVGLAAGLPTLGLPALAALGLPFVLAALGAAIHRTLRWTVGEEQPMMAVRSGILGRELALVPLDRVQGVTVTSTPLERMQHLATLRVVLGGGATVKIPYLTTGQAEDLQHRLARTTSRLVTQPTPSSPMLQAEPQRV